MRFDELNESNYLLFAIKFYDNPQSVTRDDFESDLKRIRYVKRLLKRYKNNGELKVHLILNHLIILFNVFNDAAVPLLFYNLKRPGRQVESTDRNHCVIVVVAGAFLLNHNRAHRF